MIWIITANSNLCRIYEFDKHDVKLNLLKEIKHPENKQKKSEYLTSDKPGSYGANGSVHGSFSQQSDPKEVVIENFSREIAHELNKGRNSNSYKNLVIITPPHMKGLLTKHLDKHVKELVSKEIQKDVMQLTQHEFVEYLKELKHNFELQ